MARHFSTKDFFRQIPNALLARYFQARGLFGNVDFWARTKTQSYLQGVFVITEGT